MARRNTFEAVAKELAERDAPTALQMKQWLLDFANKQFGKRPHQGADVADDIYEGEHAVPLMTIHKSKGRGYTF
jgi:ATP-dependent exoDNAse (exonuclease V) beta subunit